jgi:fatty-acyl-CoA synthase
MCDASAPRVAPAFLASRQGVGYPAAVRSPLHNLGSWPGRRARIAPDRLAVVDGGLRLDYAALEERSARLAGWLRAGGVGPGERVALLLANRSAYLEAVFATARLGAIAVPLNTLLAPPEIRYLLGHAQPRTLLHEAALAQKVAASDGDAVPWRLAVGGPDDAYEAALAAARPAREVHAASPEDPVILMYTSGTTGLPKGALLPQRKSLYNCLNAQLFFELTSRDRVLVVLPLFHSFGLQILSLPVLYAGGTVVLERRFEAEAAWRRIAVEGITFLGGVPTLFRDLLETLEAASGRLERASLRFLFGAGAAMPVELIHAFERHGLLLKQGFGQTETSILCCLEARDALRKAGSVGRPVFHADVRVVRPAGLDLPPERWEETEPGETGEIVVHGPITMLGYWKAPEETAQVLRDGWLRTGDLARRDAEGFVSLVGRARELYISGGENVYPAQVEAVYAEHPAIREIAVVGVPDERWGEVGRAYVVLAPGVELEPEALARWGRERLAAFKIPRSWIALPALPRTASGKVQKHRLAELAPGP